ncbi:SGNH/GDSL hydrolase family protein [Agromyces sp. H66]|uniref:SGNH/GDSL hydrolase family protein n=1 Tax=Agromyces sp. H66 TaxID=2529859 RepID=UPI00145C04C6|nr:SGNH/GDSL hydrolase family protein [Agromyces sp. H66]
MRPVADNPHRLVRVGSGGNAVEVEGPLSTRRVHRVRADVAAPRLYFANRVNELGRSRPGTAELTIGVEVTVPVEAVLDGAVGPRPDANTARLPVTFAGRASIRLGPGAAGWSDPLPVRLRAGDTISTVTVVSAEHGPVPLGSASDSRAHEGVVRGDARGSAFPPSTGYGYSPWLIAGEPDASHAPFLVIIGDSNAVGYGDRRGTADHFGWVARGLEPWCDVVNLAVSGAVTACGIAFDLPGGFRPEVAIVALGTNDLQGGADASALRERLGTAWRRALDLAGEVVAATIPPLTASRDGWSTLGGQVPVASPSARPDVNDWIRSRPAPLSGLIDLAAAVEGPGGRWLDGMTADGVHASPTGHAAMAEAALAWLRARPHSRTPSRPARSPA